MTQRLVLRSGEDGLPAWGAVSAIALVAASVLAAFGLPPVDLHGPLHYLGLMDPFCGGTRAARLFMLGDWQAALRYNPGIFAVAGLMGLGILRWIVGRLTGGWWSIRIPRRARVWSLAVALLVLEIHQQANASLLMAR